MNKDDFVKEMAAVMVCTTPTFELYMALGGGALSIAETDIFGVHLPSIEGMVNQALERGLLEVARQLYLWGSIVGVGAGGSDFRYVWVPLSL